MNVANGANTGGCHCVVERGKRVGVGWRFALLRRSDSCLRLKSAPLDDDRRKTPKGLVKPMVRKRGKCGCPFAECFGIGSPYSELPQSTATSLVYEMESRGKVTGLQQLATCLKIGELVMNHPLT